MDYRLSIEELAFALGHLGGADVATGFIVSVLGDLPEAEVKARLVAACHSLAARGLLQANSLQAQARLEPAFAQVVGALVQNQRLLRCNIVDDQDDQLITFFLGAAGWVESYVEFGVIAVLSPLSADTDATANVGLIARVVQRVPHRTHRADQPTGSLGHMSAESLQQLRDASQPKPELVRALVAQGFAEPIAQDVVECVTGATSRGSLINISASADGHLISNRGILFAAQANCAVYLALRSSEPSKPPDAEAYWGTREALAMLLQTVLA